MFHLILIFLYIMLVLELALWNAKINKKKRRLTKRIHQGGRQRCRLHVTAT